LTEREITSAPQSLVSFSLLGLANPSPPFRGILWPTWQPPPLSHFIHLSFQELFGRKVISSQDL
jgi:hypothetical protein